MVLGRATRGLSKLVFFQPSGNTIQGSLDFPKLPQQQAPGSLARIPATPQGSCFWPLIWRMNCAAALLRATRGLSKLVFFQPSGNTIQGSLDFSQSCHNKKLWAASQEFRPLLKDPALAADLADELRRCAVALAKLFHLIGVIKAFATDLPPENCFGSNLLFHFLFLQDAIGDVKEPKHHCHSSRNDESMDLVRIVPYRTNISSEDEAEQQAYHQDKFFPVSHVVVPVLILQIATKPNESHDDPPNDEPKSVAVPVMW
eukprot:CAMPEP_0172778044 /NCGR_PEP_ID=MMETSP1074-20121228/201709_1 /TAXON_ID=2916 /ORGANISM="Ceratium fusus, Strain PA161109" /LENGTH=257 /DNA_ID=CAMNT_0013614973 /DNA_START=116 /DNA_END=888 /DNA_ORIENTATION=-